MLEQTVWKATAVNGETCHFGHEGTARAWARANGAVEKLVIRMPSDVPKSAVERELATARGLCSSVCDDDALNEADAELLKLRKVEEAAELACGLLWMVEDRREKVRAAFNALRDALGGSGSKGLGKAIQRAIDAGHEADHPPGADWWAGKKERHYPEEWGPSDNRRLTCICGNPDPFHATKTPNAIVERPGAAFGDRSARTTGCAAKRHQQRKD